MGHIHQLDGVSFASTMKRPHKMTNFIRYERTNSFSTPALGCSSITRNVGWRVARAKRKRIFNSNENWNGYKRFVCLMLPIRIRKIFNLLVAWLKQTNETIKNWKIKGKNRNNGWLNIIMERLRSESAKIQNNNGYHAFIFLCTQTSHPFLLCNDYVAEHTQFGIILLKNRVHFTVQSTTWAHNPLEYVPVFFHHVNNSLSKCINEKAKWCAIIMMLSNIIMWKLFMGWVNDRHSRTRFICSEFN